MTRDVILVDVSRTAIGTFRGVFENTPAPVLGSRAVQAASQRSNVPSEAVNEVILGDGAGVGLGQNVARQVAIGAGLNPAIGGTTINKVCGSGLKAVMLAAQGVQCGDAGVVMAGGAENMSRAPYLPAHARCRCRRARGNPSGSRWLRSAQSRSSLSSSRRSWQTLNSMR